MENKTKKTKLTKEQKNKITVIAIAVTVVTLLVGLIIGLLITDGSKYDTLPVSYSELKYRSSDNYVVPTVPSGVIEEGKLYYDRYFDSQDEMRLTSTNKNIIKYSFMANFDKVHVAIESQFNTKNVFNRDEIGEYTEQKDSFDNSYYVVKEILPAVFDGDNEIEMERTIVKVFFVIDISTEAHPERQQAFKIYAKAVTENANSLLTKLLEIAENITTQTM